MILPIMKQCICPVGHFLQAGPPALHKLHARKNIRNHRISAFRRNDPVDRLFDMLSGKHTTWRSHLNSVIVNIHTDLCAKTRILSVDDSIHDSLADGFFIVFRLFHPNHSGFSPFLFRIGTDKIHCGIQLVDQSAFNLFIVQSLPQGGGFVQSVPPRAKNSAMAEDRLIREQRSGIGQITVRIGEVKGTVIRIGDSGIGLF